MIIRRKISSNEEFLTVASKIASSLPTIALPEYKSPYIADELKSSLISRAGLKAETSVEDCFNDYVEMIPVCIERSKN